MQEMTITSVHALGPRYAVILKEKDADRYLPILVGASDANAIAIKLHNPQVSLNLTHDLLCTVIDALGGSVRQVLINRDCPDQKERCCLRSSTIGGRGPFCPPGYVRRSEDRLCEPRSPSLDHRLHVRAQSVAMFGDSLLPDSECRSIAKSCFRYWTLQYDPGRFSDIQTMRNGQRWHGDFDFDFNRQAADVRELRGMGLRQATIGAVVGLSQVRISQILSQGL